MGGVCFAQDAPVFYGEEVVVTATRIPQINSELPYSVTVITSREIETFGAKNLGDIIRYTFSTYPKTNGPLGASSTGNIRGAAYGQTLVLIDGERLNSPLLGGVDLGDIPVNNAERVEIVRGPASAVYGADAIGGVINVITKKSQDGVDLRAELAETGANFSRLSFGQATSNTNYLLSVDLQNSPGIITNGDYSSQNYSGQFGWEASDIVSVGLGLDAYGASKGVPGSLTYPSATARQEDHNTRVRALVSTRFSDSSQVKISGSFNRMGQLFSYDPSSAPFQTYDSDTSVISLQHDARLSGNNTFSWGLELRDDKGRSEISGSHEVENRAAFIEDRWDLGNTASVFLSGRMDSHSVYGEKLSPRLGLVYKPLEKLSVRISYGEAFRAPTLNDLYTFIDVVGPGYEIIMQGNTGLKPETSRNSEIGLTYKLFENTELSMNYFTSKVENLIEWTDVSGAGVTWEPENISSASISGGEIFLSYFPVKNLKISLGATTLAPIDDATGLDLVYRPRLSSSLGLEYHDEEGVNIGALLRCVGERYDNKSNSRKMPAYSVLDLKISKDILEDTRISFSADNLLNENYQDTYDYPMPGRRYAFGVRYNLL